MRKSKYKVTLYSLTLLWILILIYILYQSKGIMKAFLILSLSLLAGFIGFLIGKIIYEREIARLLGEHTDTKTSISSIVETFKNSIQSTDALTDLAVKLEEAISRETAARTGAAYMLATQPIYEISMEVISPRGDKEVITTVWGDAEKPQNESRIILKEEDDEGNSLILRISVDSKYEENIRQIGQKVLELVIKRWNNLIKMYTDPLTGARNRGYLDIALKKINGTRESVAIFMIDLDHFKEVNDTLGHEKGDEVLKEVVKRMKHALRSEDEIIRYGGDEFVIIIRDIGLRNTYKVAERLKNTIADPPIVETIPVTASIGVAYKLPGRPLNAEKALKTADEAVYEAKKKRNTFYVFEEG